MSSDKTKKQNRHLRGAYDSLEKYREVGEVIADFHGASDYNPRTNYGEDMGLLGPGVFRAKYIATPKWERTEELKKDYARFLKSDLLEAQNIKVKYDLTDKEMELVIQRKNQLDLMGFDSWLAQTFKPDNPRTNRILKKFAPGYYTRRQEQLKLVREYQNKIADIRMFGPKNEDDLAFMYWYDQGLTTPKVQKRGPHEKFVPGEEDPDEYQPISHFGELTRFSYNHENPKRLHKEPERNLFTPRFNYK